MRSFRFIHCADLHLDSPFAGLSGLSETIRSHLQQSTFEALKRLVRLAMAEQADFVVVSGDVYDSAHTSLRAQLRFVEAAQELYRAGIPMYVIHGNHDPLNSPRAALDFPPNVHVFGPEPESVTANRRADGEAVAVIAGMSYPVSKVTDNIALRYPRTAENPELFHIGLLHASVDGDTEHETYAPCTSRELMQTGFDYWALGHIHKRGTLRESPWIVYPGNIQGRHIRETGPKGCYLVEVDEQREVRLHFHETDSVRWFSRDITIEGCLVPGEFMAAVEQAVEDIAEEFSSGLSLVRFSITGRGPLHTKLEEGYILDDLLSEMRRRTELQVQANGLNGCVWIESFSLQSGTELQLEQLSSEDSFTGELLRLAGRELASEEDSDLVRSALRPLLEQPELRRLLEEVTWEEKRDWLRRGMEYAAVLFMEESGRRGDAE